MIINLSTPLSDDKERQRRNEVILAAIEQYTEERMNDAYGRIHTDGSRSGGQPVLKPCPFCGGEAAIVEFQAAGGPWWMGECQEPSCDAAGPAFTTEAEAIAAYNTRQPTQSDVGIPISDDTWEKE